MTFTNALVKASFSGLLRAAVIRDKDSEAGVLALTLFKANPTLSTFTDNSPIVIHDSDIAKIIGVVAFAAADYVAYSASSLATKLLTGLPIQLDEAGRDIYGSLHLISGTPTYTATSDISVSLGILQE